MSFNNPLIPNKRTGGVSKGRQRVSDSWTATSIVPSTTRCRHCGRIMNDFAGGSAKVGPNPVCHPNAKNRPDCYKLVTVYGHPMPCDSDTCREDHTDLLTYVDARQNKEEATV